MFCLLSHVLALPRASTSGPQWPNKADGLLLQCKGNPSESCRLRCFAVWFEWLDQSEKVEEETEMNFHKGKMKTLSQSLLPDLRSLRVLCGIVVVNIARTTHKGATGRRWRCSQQEAAAQDAVVVWVFDFRNLHLWEVFERSSAQREPYALWSWPKCHVRCIRSGCCEISLTSIADCSAKEPPMCLNCVTSGVKFRVSNWALSCVIHGCG